MGLTGYFRSVRVARIAALVLAVRWLPQPYRPRLA